MMSSNSSADYRPLFWMGRHPIGVSVLLLGIHTLAMVVFSLAQAVGYEGLFTPLIFQSSDVLNHGYLWQLFTYPFVASASVMFLVQMLMFFWFGPSVEQFIGRSYFIALYLALVIIPALFLTGYGYFYHSVAYAGADSILFGLFIAYVAIYPNAEFFLLQIPLKWVAAALLAIYTLADLANHSWLHLSLLWLSTTIAAVSIRSMGVATGMGFFDRIADWFEQRRMERLARQNNLRILKEQEKVQSIDMILDKISKHGMGSLTPIEKKILERASADLIKRDKHP